MIQITDKLFAVPIPEAEKCRESIGRIFNDRDVRWQLTEFSGKPFVNFYADCNVFGGVIYNVPLEAGDYKILGTVSKDTIDFDVEGYVEKHYYYPSYYRDYESENTKDDWYKHPKGSFRSLLASKGCDPNAKHLIIKQEKL